MRPLLTSIAGIFLVIFSGYAAGCGKPRPQERWGVTYTDGDRYTSWVSDGKPEFHGNYVEFTRSNGIRYVVSQNIIATSSSLPERVAFTHGE